MLNGQLESASGIAALSTNRGSRYQWKAAPLDKSLKPGQGGADYRHPTRSGNLNFSQMPWTTVLFQPSRCVKTTPWTKSSKSTWPVIGALTITWLAVLDKQAFLHAGLNEDPGVQALDNGLPCTLSAPPATPKSAIQNKLLVASYPQSFLAENVTVVCPVKWVWNQVRKYGERVWRTETNNSSGGIGLIFLWDNSAASLTLD